MYTCLFPEFDFQFSGHDYPKTVLNRSSFLYERMAKVLADMKNVSTSPLLKSDLFLTTRFCEVYSLVGQITDFDPTIYIELETDLSVSMELLLINQLKYEFEGMFNIHIFSPISFKERVDNADIIIASSSNINLEEVYDLPIVYVSLEFQPADLLNITFELEKIRRKKQYAWENHRKSV